MSLVTATQESAPAKVAGRYTLLGFVSSSHAIAHMYFALMPLVYPQLLREFSLTYAQLGLFLTAAGMAGGGMQLVFGFTSRFISRPLMLGLGSIAVGVSTFGAGVAASPVLFFGWNILARVAHAAQHPLGNALLAERFEQAGRGRAISLHFAGGNVGTVSVPLIAALVITSLGWRPTLYLFAIPGLIVGVLFILLIREDVGARFAAAERPFRHFSRQVFATLRDYRILMIVAAGTLAAGGRGTGVVLVFVPTYLNDAEKGLGLDLPFVGSLVTLLAIGSVGGPLLAGWFSDISRAGRALVGAYVVAAVTTVLFAGLVRGDWLLAAVLTVMGVSVYAQNPQLQILLAEVTETSTRDAIYGVYFTVSQISGALWVPAIGYVVDTLGFHSGFYVMAVSYLAAALCIVLVLKPRATRLVTTG